MIAWYKAGQLTGWILIIGIIYFITKKMAKPSKTNNKLSIRQYIGIVLTVIGFIGISSVKEKITGSVCTFGKGCVDKVEYIWNWDKIVVVIIIIVVGIVLWLYPKKKKV